MTQAPAALHAATFNVRGAIGAGDASDGWPIPASMRIQ
jgi:hypothetical protein